MSFLNTQVVFEPVQLPDGRYAVQEIGADGPYEAAGDFDSLTEAEEWIFLEAQRREALAGDPGIQLPGGGQGIR